MICSTYNSQVLFRDFITFFCKIWSLDFWRV